MSASLIFDDTLELCDQDGSVSGGSFWFEALADGTSFGDPQPIEVAISSLMRDGAIVSKVGDGNRETVFVIKVRATDQGALDDGIAALHRATGKRTTLVWTPPDGFGPVRVWDVETSNLLEPSGFDDLAYVMRSEQVFRLRLVCQPFRRGVDRIVDNAGSPPSTGGTLLYNFESTTGWARVGAGMTAEYVVDGTIYSEGAGSLRSRATFYQTSFYSYPDGQNVISASHDGVSGLSLSTGTGGYLSMRTRFEWIQTSLNIYVTTSTGGRVKVVNPLAIEIDAAGFTRYVWPTDGGLTVTGFDVEWGQRGPASTSNIGHFWMDDLELLPAATTDHQIVKQLDVQGSAPTTGSLRISAPTDVIALGKVLAITAPTAELPPGFTPDGRRWVTQGTTTTDTSTPDGSYYTPSTSTYDAGTGKPIFDVPVGLLTPGPYMMVALVKVESSPTVAGVQAQLRIGTTNTGPTSAAEVSLPNLTTGWQFVTLGTVYLPPLPLQSPSTTAKVRLLFKGAKLSNVYMIPAWQVDGRPVADFSIVDCGTGTPAAGGSSSNLWVDSPSVDQPQGGWWRGPTSDRANAQSAWPDAKKPGVHTFKPGSLTAFLVSTNAQGPTMGLEYFDRYL